MEFSRPEYWSGQPFPSPGGLPNPEIKPRSPALQADSLPSESQGSPRIREWEAYPFSRGPSQPRNRTGVSCIAGRFFSWATREYYSFPGIILVSKLLIPGLPVCHYCAYEASTLGLPFHQPRTVMCHSEDNDNFRAIHVSMCIYVCVCVLRYSCFIILH